MQRIDEKPIQEWLRQVADASFGDDLEARARAYRKIGPPPPYPKRYESRVQKTLEAIRSFDNLDRFNHPVQAHRRPARRRK